MLLKPVTNKTARVITLISFFILSQFILSDCEEEEAKSRDYPRVKTMPVSNITGNGATFNGEIYSLGSETVIEHGFVWGSAANPTLINNRIFLGATGITVSYSADIVTTLKKDLEYTVRSFVQTAEHIIYGIPVTFKSLGSGAPVIVGFEPDSAVWMDTITVKGKNFSWRPEENIVKLNQVRCVTLGSTDTTLSILVDCALADLKSVLSVELAGNVAMHAKDTLNLIPPVLTDFYPVQARWNDTIYLRGRSLNGIACNNTNFVKLGAVKCKYLKSYADSAIAILVPYEVSTVSSNLSMFINGFNLAGREQFQLLQPYFTMTPNEGTWGNTISLNGAFNTIASRNSVFFDNVKATIISSSASLLKIQVPAALSKVKTNIVYTASPFSVSSTDTFRLKEPVINSYSPLSGAGNITVTIKGKYFSDGNTTVKFGTATGVITSMNDSTIYVKVPGGINGTCKISVTVKLQTITSSQDFTSFNPLIKRVYPLSGTFNDELTIEGENFPTSSHLSVRLGNFGANVISISATSIVCKVPVGIDSIPRSIVVSTLTDSYFSTDKFTLSPPQVISIMPESIVPGQDITINGLNFNPVLAGNVVFWDIYPLTVKSATPTTIIATLPNSLPRGSNKIKVITGGYSRFSPQELSINSQWLRISSPVLSTNSIGRTTYTGMTIYGEATGSFGYLCSPASNIMYKFDPLRYGWTDLITSTPFYLTTKMGEVVCNDSLYLISGFDYNTSDGSGMYAYNEVLNIWDKISFPFNQRTGVAFSLNSKIYYGLSYRPWNILALDLWECDPGNNYSWKKKSNFPLSALATYSAYFSLNDKGYVIFSDNTIWQYDPVLDVWTKKSDFPGPKRELAVSFVIGEYAYFGTGANGSTNYNDIWRYDPVADSWSQIPGMPNARNSGVAFVINNKAYVGYGVGYDFYEFDPGW